MCEINFFKKCKLTRKNTLTILDKSRRGHLPSALSCVEILVALYYFRLKINVKDPQDPDRDRFVFSKGHGCLSYYAVLGELGFFDKSEWNNFCTPNGILGGHPDRLKIPGVDCSSGSLGLGPSVGVGMAYAAKLEKKNHHVFVLVGDGECGEGSVWESLLSATKNKLDNFTLIVDCNKYQSYGSTDEITYLGDLQKKFSAFGFESIELDLIKDPYRLVEELRKKNIKDMPKAIICNTIKGMGIKAIEGNLEWHHKTAISDDEMSTLWEGLEK